MVFKKKMKYAEDVDFKEITDNNVDELDFEKMDKEKKLKSKESEKKSTVIDLKDEKNDVSEKVVLDFVNDNNYEDVLSKKSKPAEDSEQESQFAGKSQDELREEIKQAEIESKQNFSAKDMEDIAKVIIMVIDTGISTGFRMWAKDTSDSAYSIPAEKRKMLEYQLTLILIKYQSKFSIEFMFLISLVICYAVPFTKARERRKMMKEAEENPEIAEQVKRGKGKPAK